MCRQRGMTLIEMMIVVAFASLILVAVAAYTVPWLAREGMRSAVYDVQTFMQLARIEAVSRNHACRFVINTDNGRVRVFDTNGTNPTGDDVMLYERTLPSSVSFARPDAGAPVTLSQIGASDEYQTVFTSDGIVALGPGEVVLLGGQRYGRVSVFGAGGIQVERWNGSTWHVGS